MQSSDYTATIRYNCDISDARDNGIYSVCTLVLKLRNLYKWENNIEPWAEPDAAALLDWIDRKENYWQSVAGEPYRPLVINGKELEPWDLAGVNAELRGMNLVYGAGYGLSLKTVFFLAQLLDLRNIAGCQVYILGKEYAKELASPFAMLQDGVIYIRREPLRFFFWDQIQEIRSSCKTSFYHALAQYNLIRDGHLDRAQLPERLDEIVDHELPIFIHHEVGEYLQDTFSGGLLQEMIAAFPGTIYEFASRAVKDVLADVHPQGMLHFIIQEQRESSLGFYLGFLSGLRRVLFPELAEAFSLFLETKDWQLIAEAVHRGRVNNQQRAEKIEEIVSQLSKSPVERVKEQFAQQILRPLGLETPES